MAIYHRLLRYVRPHAGVFLGAVAAMACYAATDTGLAAMMKPMLDGSFVNRDPFWVKMIPPLFIILALLRGASGFLSSYSMSWIGRRVIKKLRRQIFHQLLRLPASFYDGTSSGNLISKMSYDVEQVARATTQAVTPLVRDTLTIVGLLAWMFYLNWMLSLVFLVIGPVIAGLVLYVNRRLRRISSRIQASMGNVAHVTEEAIEGYRVIKTFGGQHYEEAHFEEANERNRQQHMKLSATSSASVQVIMLTTAIVLAGIVYLATLPSMLEKITVGGFMSFIVAMMMLLAPIKRLTTLNVFIQRGIAAAKSIFDLLDAEAERDTGKHRIRHPKGAVRYSDVSFAYDRSKGKVLEEINLSIEPTQTVAFVGRSGSGKTTLASLLPRFYDTYQGQILLDGQDIRTLSLSNLRDQIALVGQQVTLFNDTIMRNIAYGRLESVAEGEIIQAAEAAHAMEFIRELPEGLHTLVGENGVLLSGGQRQRLAIARALLKNAPILILDEATSSLDSESERHIQAALDRLIQHRTTLVIAHRLSTIEKADMIVVMDKGRIVETGNHKELLVRDGHYASLHRMQFHPPQEAPGSLRAWQ